MGHGYIAEGFWWGALVLNLWSIYKCTESKRELDTMLIGLLQAKDIKIQKIEINKEI